MHLEKQEYKTIRLRFRDGSQRPRWSSPARPSAPGRRGNVGSVGVLQPRKSLQSRKTAVGGDEEALLKGTAKSGAWVINN